MESDAVNKRRFHIRNQSPLAVQNCSSGKVVVLALEVALSLTNDDLYPKKLPQNPFI
jgi:energy-converting hydrogenase Eha subunit F